MQTGQKLKVLLFFTFIVIVDLFMCLGTSLNQELYYKISCQKDEGYCLFVSNCTVSTSVEQSDSYTIIDNKGCTNEPSLFEHVEVS